MATEADMMRGKLIETNHLIEACDTTERVAGLAVLISLASAALVMTSKLADDATVGAQILAWQRAIDDLQAKVRKLLAN